MIPVSEVLARIFDMLPAPGREDVALAQAAGRVLAEPIRAARDEPPFAASAMDGYALKDIEADPEALFQVIGEAAAGRPFAGRVGPGQCVRIFTGAPVPAGADRVIMQEEASRRGNLVTLARSLTARPFIRPAGTDFRQGEEIVPPRPLSPADLALVASMNIAQVPVTRRPRVAILPTGDELVMPGETPAPGQIVASNPFALAAIARTAGARSRMLPIARDTAESLTFLLGLTRGGDQDSGQGADLIVTTGGAAVGDYDLVAGVVRNLGGTAETLDIAMRPGKRLILGRLGRAVLLGLPGTPTAAMATAHVFMVPVIRALSGLGRAAAARGRAELATGLPENGAQEVYVQARLGAGRITPIRGKHGLVACARANALLIRPAGDPARAPGEQVEYLDIQGCGQFAEQSQFPH